MAAGPSTARSRPCSGGGSGSAGAATPPAATPRRRGTNCWNGPGRNGPPRSGRWPAGYDAGCPPAPASGPARCAPTTDHVERHLVPHLGRIRLGDLNGRDVAAMFTALAPTETRLGRPPTPSTLHRIRATLRSALNAAIRDGVLRDNPARLAELPTPRRPQAHVWTDPRVDAWRRTGLRWVDVDLDQKIIMVDQQRLAYGHTVAVGPPKTAASRRTIALDRTMVRLLRARLGRQQAERIAVGDARQDSGYVFTTPDGSPLHPDWLTRRFRRLVTDSGLPPVRLHDLRHGAASLAHAAGADLKTVQEQLGHTSIVLTGQVGPPHCCGGPPSGPCRRVPTHTAQASRGGGSGSSAVKSRCSSRPGRVSSPGRSSRVRGVFVDRLTAGAYRGGRGSSPRSPSW